MSEHEIAELLPFYVNGTLEPAERARVEAELATCSPCATELRELEALGASLQSRAAAAPPFPQRALEDALARIGTPPALGVLNSLRGPWWGIPARYATAAALVVGFGAAAVAAYHAHEAEVALSTPYLATTGEQRSAAGTTVYHVTPAPNAPKFTIDSKERTRGVPLGQGAAAVAPAQAKQHRLARKAHLELLVRDVEGTLKRAQSAVRDAGGEVTGLADASPRTDDAVHGATLEVEIPADRLDAILDRLAALGTVQNRTIEAEDVDAAIVDEEARLRNLRREETALRALMGKGGKVEEILHVQESLSTVRGEIEQLDAKHQHDLRRVATSTVALSLTEDRPNPAPAKPGPTARIDGAWHSGLNALADTLIGLLSTIAWCTAYAPIPLSLAALTYAGLRLLKNRFASA